MTLAITKKKLIAFHRQDIDYAIEAANSCFRGDAMSRCRVLQNVYSRQAISIYLRELGFVFSEIGKLLGFDHANIVHLTKKHKHEMMYNKEYKIKFYEFMTLVDRKANASSGMIYCYQYPLDYLKMTAKNRSLIN